MGARSRVDSRWETGLPQLLLLVIVSELVLYRLLVPALRPRADVQPALWHSALTYAGLFLFYFASALAVGVVARQLWQVATRRERFGRIVGSGLSIIGAGFLVLAAMSIVRTPSSGVTFALEAAFVATLFLSVVGQWRRRGDLGVAIGQIFVALPLLVHFYAPLSVRFIVGEEAIFNGLTDQVDNVGRWLVLLAALSMPYFFGARPFLLRAARLPPLIAAMLVALLGATLIRANYVSGMEMAQNGLGISVGPHEPGSLIALYLLALAAVAWTFVNCVTAPSEQRRNIGIGLALVVSGGYAFSWPLQYLAGIAGFLTIAHAATSVSDEERSLLPAKVPAIDDDVWQAYLTAVVERLRQRLGEELEASIKELGAPELEAPIKVLSIRGDGGQTRSYFVYEDQDIPVTVTVERLSGAIVGLDIRCGDSEVTGPPIWSLYRNAASESGLLHPSPPKSSAGRLSSDALPAPLRDDFVVQDHEAWSDKLLTDELATRLAEQMPGWVACWPEGTLRVQIYPGRGASLGHPIPIVALSLNNKKATPDALTNLLELLVDVAVQSRALAAQGRDSET